MKALTRARNLLPALLVASLLPTAAIYAAEIRGRVSLQPPAQQSGLISVALFPLEGQALPQSARREYNIEVRDNRLVPDYVVARPGDRLQFVNRDSDYFALFSPVSADDAAEIPLEPAGRDNRASLELGDVEMLHVFCRIHAGIYGRIDVLDTPYSRLLRAGEEFEFRGLQAGRWQLRVSAPGVETQQLDVVAMTAPPPLEVSLQSLMLTNSAGVDLHQPVVVEQLFPADPGF